MITWWRQSPLSISKPFLACMANPMINIRLSWGRLIFIMGIPKLARRHRYTETADPESHGVIRNGIELFGLTALGYQATRAPKKTNLTFISRSPIQKNISIGSFSRPLPERMEIQLPEPIGMMTSSIGNILRVTGPLWGESTGHHWIPITKASDTELWYFLWSASEQTAEQALDTPVIWDAIALIMMSL